MDMKIEEKVENDKVAVDAPPVPPVKPDAVAKKKVILALPGNTFSSAFVMSLLATMNAVIESNKYQLIVSPGVSSFVPFARMQTMGLNVLRGIDQKPFNGEQYDYWVSIDSDQVFAPEQLFNLLDSLEKNAVVAGCYRMSNLTHLPVVEKWDTEFFKKHGSFEFIKVEDLETWKKENEDEEFREVAYAGMGFFGMRKEVLDLMRYPYFDGEPTTITSDDGVTLRDIMSEDVAFCKNIQKAGHKVMLNVKLRVGHEKSIVI
jgi:hypothetical protein